MTSKAKTITVNGKTYQVYSDYLRRGTYAKDESGKELTLRSSGYMSNEHTIKKTIKALEA